MKSIFQISLFLFLFTYSFNIHADDFFSVHINATPNELLVEDDVVTYTISVINSGIAEPSYLTLSDPMFGAGFTNHTGDVNADGILNLTETWVYIRTYIVTADDISSNGGGDGRINSIITAKGYDAGGNLTQLTGVPHEVWIGLNPNTIPAPTGNANQYICDGEAITLEDLAVFNTTGFSSIIWFDDTNQTTAIALNTLLVEGTTYYAFQGLGTDAISLAVTISAGSDIPDPDSNSEFYLCDGESISLSEIAVFNTSGFNGLYWFDDANQFGNAINPETYLSDGDVYWVYQGLGACAMGKEITFHVVTDIPAPTGSSPQQFCDSDTTLDFEDIVVFYTAGFSDITLYLSNDNTGAAINPKDALISGTYYAFQGYGSCAVSLQVVVEMVSTIPVPIGSSPVFFCEDPNLTFESIGFSNAIWYTTDDNTGVPINPTDTIIAGIYYVFLGGGDCADSLEVEVVIVPTIPVPTGDSPQQFCDLDTTLDFDDIVVFNTPGFSNIIWYPTDNNTGVAINPTDTLTAGTYYAFQGNGSCAVSLQVVVEMIPDITAPTGDSPQQFCDTDTTLDFTDIVVFNTSGFYNITWYPTDDNNGTPINPISTLIAGTYYAFQGEGDCAISLEVIVEMVPDIPAPTGDSLQQFCELDLPTLEDIVVSNTSGFSTILWYADAAQTFPLDPSDLLLDGVSYYAFQGVGDCAVTLEVQVEMFIDIPPPNGPSTYNCNASCTLADINVTPTLTGASIYWFAINDNTGTQLSTTTSLVVDATYYAFQNLGSCAVSLAVLITNTTVDSDGDGVTDATEALDGTDPLDLCDFILSSQTEAPSSAWNNADCDEDGVYNQWEIAGDADDDTIYDVFDADDDGDGINTIDENPDPNADGNPDDAQDTDLDGIPDYLDADDDADSIPTLVEAVEAKSVNVYLDTDEDGAPNYLDDDDDGDGTPTIEEDYDGDGDPTNDDINDNGIPDYLDEEVTASIKEITSLFFKIFPNPVNKVLTIRLKDNYSKLNLTITTIQGQIVFQKGLQQKDKIIIDVSNFITGVYLLNITSNKLSQTQKIIVE